MAIKDKILSANDVKQSAEMYKTMKSSLNEKKDRDGGKMWTSLVTGNYTNRPSLNGYLGTHCMMKFTKRCQAGVSNCFG